MEKKTNFSKGLKNQEIILKELFPKSLVIFIGIGLFSGLAFGVYLFDIKNTNQLVFVEGNSVSIVTEKIDFKKGEEMKLQIINSGTTLLVFSDASYGLRITGLSGILMYTPISVQVISELKPNEEAELVWNQIKNDGDAALDGIYKISSYATNVAGKSIEKSISITIWK